MGSRSLDLKLLSAKHLKDVNFISKMDVYVIVSLTGDIKKQKVKSPADLTGGCNPTWNFPIRFTVDDSLARQNRISLVLTLKSQRALGDKEIGEVIVPIKELLDSPGDGKSPQFVSYQVRTPSGKSKGELHFSYQFGDLIPIPVSAPPPPPTAYGVSAAPSAVYGVPASKSDEPAMAYPPPGTAGSSSTPYPPAAAPYAPPPSTGYAYPHPQEKVGYGYPPPAGYPYQPGYGAYPAQGGYGYPMQQVAQQPPKKNNKFGMGLGAGLVGGMLGGLLIGDMVSDVADYDAGDMDMGGFDF